MPDLTTRMHNEAIGLTCFAAEKITISDSALGLTAATYNVAGENVCKAAIITVDAQPIRVTLDGSTTPAASVGHGFDADDIIFISGQGNLANFSAIREGGTDADIQVSYLR